MSGYRFDRLKILIVDDNPHLRKLVATILHAFGGRQLNPDGSFGFVGPAAVRSVDLVHSFIERRIVPEEATGSLVTDLVCSGPAAPPPARRRRR